MIMLKSKIEAKKILKFVLLALIYALWCYFFFEKTAHAYTVYYNANSYPGYTYQCSYYGKQGYCYYVNDYGYYDKGPTSTTYPYNYYYGQNVGIALGVGRVNPN